MGWIINVVVSAIVSSVISVTLVSFVINKFKFSFDLQNNGIKRIHAKGQAVKSFEKMLRSDKCKEIKVLGFSAHGFTHSYRSELTKYVASGGHIKYLLSNPDTLFVRQAAEMEGRSENSISNSVNSSIEIINKISQDAKEHAKRNGRTSGTIEVRFYDTEIRNQLLLCTDNDNNTIAWMSILTPPLAAVNCQMIEYSDAENCIEYFNIIWNRHEKDTVTI